MAEVSPSLHKTIAMEKTEKDYSPFERFECAMDTEAIYLDNHLDYSGICSLLGLDPGPLETVLFSELGFTGDEIVRRYRQMPVKPL